MDAIRAKSASARASIAIRLIKQGRTSGRSFSNCFEMGDGDAVVREIVRRAAADPAIERGYPHVAEWRKAFAPAPAAGVGADVEAMLESARIHGEESEPDHEVGDLQAMLRAAWRRMTPAQRDGLLIDWHSDIGVWPVS